MGVLKATTIGLSITTIIAVDYGVGRVSKSTKTSRDNLNASNHTSTVLEINPENFESMLLVSPPTHAPSHLHSLTNPLHRQYGPAA